MEPTTDRGGAAEVEARLRTLEARVDELQRELAARQGREVLSLICFSGDWDRLFAAFTLASGALAMGYEVHVFFTFWSVCALRKTGKIETPCEKNLSQSMLAKVLPCGPGKARLSRMNLLGLGPLMLKRLMKKQGVADLDMLMQEVRDLGGHLHLCDTSFGLFGLSCDELTDGASLNRCGVATFLQIAMKGRMALFI
jgi:peroxiredoxin family protein